MTEAAKLEPCPFCGGQAEFSDKRPKRKTYVVCQNCAASTSTHDNAEDAATHWNASLRSFSDPDAVRALEHALVRFECLADQFEEAGDTASWAMASVDADRMRKALDATRCSSPAGTGMEEWQRQVNERMALPPAVTHNEWRSIETAPKDGSRFLVSTTQGLVHEAYYLDNSLTPWPWKGIMPSSQKVALNLFEPIRWRPLPAPPALTEKRPLSNHEGEK